MMMLLQLAKATRPAGERTAALHLIAWHCFQGQSWRVEYSTAVVVVAGAGVAARKRPPVICLFPRAGGQSEAKEIEIHRRT